LTEEEQAAITSETAAIKLMKEHTSAIRRPIIETGKDYLVRFNEEEYKSKLLK
jgi:arsenate reductase